MTTNLEDIAAEDLARAKSSVVISSAHQDDNAPPSRRAGPVPAEDAAVRY